MDFCKVLQGFSMLCPKCYIVTFNFFCKYLQRLKLYIKTKKKLHFNGIIQHLNLIYDFILK